MDDRQVLEERGSYLYLPFQKLNCWSLGAKTVPCSPISPDKLGYVFIPVLFGEPVVGLEYDMKRQLYNVVITKDSEQER